MSVTTEPFGKTRDGRDITLFTITNSNGSVLKLTDLGAVWVSMFVKDKDGKLDDVVLGLKSGDRYETATYDAFGATVGRSANRISHFRFTLNSKEYILADNDKGCNLHSGPDMYYFRLWDAQVVSEDSGEGVCFSLFSPDGDQGLPGNLDVSVTYLLTEDDSVIIDYHGVSDADTIINMTNHAYFNLAGHASGTVHDELLWIDADYYTFGKNGEISDGQLHSVEGTPLDFRQLKRVGDEIDCDDELVQLKGGYDHNFCLNNNGELALVAKVVHEGTGRYMDIFTDRPGLQVYTGNYISEKNEGKEGAVYHPRWGTAYETQHYPDAINHDNFPSPIVKAGEEFRSQTIYHFGIIGETQFYER